MREVYAGQLDEELEVLRFEAGEHVPAWIMTGTPKPGSRLDALTFVGPTLAVRYEGGWRLVPLESGYGICVDGEGHIVLHSAALPVKLYGVQVRVDEGCV